MLRGVNDGVRALHCGALLCRVVLVEAAGIEPASANDPDPVLHA